VFGFFSQAPENQAEWSIEQSSLLLMSDASAAPLVSESPAAVPSAPLFSDLGLPAGLLTALQEVGYETPSPIQAACIPPLLQGVDLLGEAQTGTGKTAAFALPLLARLDLSRNAPQALVLAPTRELAIQVSEAFAKYAHHLRGFHVLPLYGGQSMAVQLRQLSRGPQVIVGTPGRIMDHIERGSLKLDALSMVVLDEADEMLRMGFIDDVEWILEHTPATRQTALFSATMPEAIRRVARAHLRDPREVKIKTATATVAAIRQKYWQVRGVDKLDALTRILEVEDDFDAAIVFVRTKTATVELADRLEARGYAAAALNGDLTQGLRERVIEQLKKGQLDIVVATDVAARGIDVPRISHVINYDIPYDTEAYVHRIGRTGRAGREGVAILFVASREMRMLRAIERATRQPIEQIALPTREAVADRRVAQFKEQVLETLKEGDLAFFTDVVSRLEETEGYSIHEIAAALALMAQRERPLQIEETGPGWDSATRLVPDRERRFEDSRSDTRRDQGRSEGFSRGGAERESRFNRSSSDRPPSERSASPPREAGFSPERGNSRLAAYRIEVGRRDGITPREIVGAIANEGGIAGRMIGQINLFDDHSTVELPADLPSSVLSTLARVRIGPKTLNLKLSTGPSASQGFSSGPRNKPAPNRDRGERRDRDFGGDRPPSRFSDRVHAPRRKDSY
jgi:ATP-dependent RNA helicase DeaD